MSVSERARAIQRTDIRKFRAKADDESLDLGIGAPDLDIPEPVRRAAVASVDAGRAPYSDNLGLPETRRAVGRHYGVDPDRVMITCGVQEGLAVALFGLVDRGDEVLVPAPGFPAYPNLVRAAGGTPVPYPLDANRGFALDAGAVRDRVTDRTAAAVLNSPSNPTGSVHDEDSVRRALDALEAAGIPWISDEIYETYVYDDAEHVSALDIEAAGAGIKLGGLSKSMHLMGWRLGWLIAPSDWVADLKPLHQHLVTCAPTPAQRAAVRALDDLEALFAPTLETFDARRLLVERRASELPKVQFAPPRGAFYLFLDVGRYTGGPVTAFDLAEAILDDCDVVVVPGTGFGDAGDGYLRVAYTVEQPRLNEAFDRLETFFEERSR